MTIGNNPGGVLRDSPLHSGAGHGPGRNVPVSGHILVGEDSTVFSSWIKRGRVSQIMTGS